VTFIKLEIDPLDDRHKHHSGGHFATTRLEEAIARYHSNAITTAEVIQEPIKLAKEIRAAHQRGEKEGLSQEEISLYDALAQNESAVEVIRSRSSVRGAPARADVSCLLQSNRETILDKC
jgi:type I site-specific restriction-modification system R (restriction) subunit